MYIFDNININKINKLLIDTNNSLNYPHSKFEDIRDYLDIKSKNIIFFLIENSKESISFYFQLIKSGTVPILFSSDTNEELLHNLYQKYEPNYILSCKKISLNKFKIKLLKKFNRYNLYSSIKKFNHQIHKDLCLMMSTSGSTGSPKLVKISYENVLENTKSICKFLSINEKHTTITTLQPHYTFGLSIINTHILQGAKIIINNNTLFEKNFWKKCLKFRVNSFGAVSFMYEILEKIKFEKFNLPDLKYLTHAGSKLNKPLHNYINNVCSKKNYKFISMYGQTEATSRISYLSWKYSKKKISSIGKAIPGGKLFIKDKKKIGEICYMGKNIMMGYANNFKDLNIKEKINILHTGDFGYKDHDNFFYLKGRKDRFIKIYGHRVNLDEIDNFLSNEGFKTCSILKKNKIIIYYEKNSLNLKIKNLISKKFNLSQNFFNTKELLKIPLTSSGKVKFSKLK